MACSLKRYFFGVENFLENWIELALIGLVAFLLYVPNSVLSPDGKLIIDVMELNN